MLEQRLAATEAARARSAEELVVARLAQDECRARIRELEVEVERVTALYQNACAHIRRLTSRVERVLGAPAGEAAAAVGLGDAPAPPEAEAAPAAPVSARRDGMRFSLRRQKQEGEGGSASSAKRPRKRTRRYVEGGSDGGGSVSSGPSMAAVQAAAAAQASAGGGPAPSPAKAAGEFLTPRRTPAGGAAQASEAPYHATVRGKKRQGLDAAACAECTKYYGTLNLDAAERQRRLNQGCRHRHLYAPPAEPDHLYQMGFGDTQEDLLAAGPPASPLHGKTERLLTPQVRPSQITEGEWTGGRGRGRQRAASPTTDSSQDSGASRAGARRRRQARAGESMPADAADSVTLALDPLPPGATADSVPVALAQQEPDSAEMGSLQLAAAESAEF